MDSGSLEEVLGRAERVPEQWLSNGENSTRARHLVMSAGTFPCQGLVTGIWCVENILPCTGKTPATKNESVQNDNIIKIEKPCSRHSN